MIPNLAHQFSLFVTNDLAILDTTVSSLLIQMKSMLFFSPKNLEGNQERKFFSASGWNNTTNLQNWGRGHHIPSNLGGGVDFHLYTTPYKVRWCYELQRHLAEGCVLL